MKRFIVSTPHPDSLAGADNRQVIFGPFDSIPEAEEFSDFFYKKFLRSARPKEDLIHIGELNDPLEKVGYKPKSDKMTDEDKIKKIETAIKGDLKVISKVISLEGIPFLEIMFYGPRVEDHMLCLLVSYVRGVVGFDLYDRSWITPGAKHLDTLLRKMPKLQDASLEIKKDIKWIKLKIQGMKKKYTAPISPV